MTIGPIQDTYRGTVMGLLNKLFGGSEAPVSIDDASPTELRCDCCGAVIEDENAMEEGQCEECYADSSGPTYCCGQIYEEGEETCRSCGDPL